MTLNFFSHTCFKLFSQFFICFLMIFWFFRGVNHSHLFSTFGSCFWFSAWFWFGLNIELSPEPWLFLFRAADMSLGILSPRSFSTGWHVPFPNDAMPWVLKVPSFRREKRTESKFKSTLPWKLPNSGCHWPPRKQIPKIVITLRNKQTNKQNHLVRQFSSQTSKLSVLTAFVLYRVGIPSPLFVRTPVSKPLPGAPSSLWTEKRAQALQSGSGRPGFSSRVPLSLTPC